ncbi:MAG: AMIN domain-containing protein [Heteroscytonema crispum UTEX LB 1556]
MVKGATTKKLGRRCKQLFGLSLFGLCIAIPYDKPKSVYAQTGSSDVQTVARLEDWRFYPETSQLELSLSAGTTPRYFYLAQPPRLVVDLPDTKLGYVPTQQNYSGAIQRIRVSQLNAGVTRLVMDLAPGTFLDQNQVQLQPASWQNNRWVLRPLINTGGINSSGFLQPVQPGSFPPSPNSDLPPNPNIYNNQPLPLNNYPPNIYNNQPPGNFNPLFSNPPFVTPPPALSTQPPNIYNNPQQPFVIVPPLTPNNPYQQPGSILPPATFPQPGNLNNAPLFPAPSNNFPVPTVPNYQQPGAFNGVIEFGQPFPNPGY